MNIELVYITSYGDHKTDGYRIDVYRHVDEGLYYTRWCEAVHPDTSNISVGALRELSHNDLLLYLKKSSLGIHRLMHLLYGYIGDVEE